MGENTQKTNRFMDWCQYKMAPAMQKFMQKPWIAGFTDGVLKCLPFILTGCLIFFYNAIRSWITVLPDLSLVQTYTFSLMALIISFLIVHEEMAKLHHRNYMVVGGLTGICTYIVAMHATIDDSYVFSVDYSRFGPTGILVAMIVALFVSWVFHMYSKVRFFKKGSAVPTFVQDWVKNIIPIFTCVLVMIIIVHVCDVDLYSFILWLFTPLQIIAQSFPGFVLLNFVQSFFYSLGVSGWVWTGLTNAYQIPAQTENLAAGWNGTQAYLNVSEITHGIGLINMGGMCATLGLNILMLFSHSKRLKTLGRITIGPSLFNINEPVIYGTPVIYNPILLIPAWICPIVGSIIVWFIFRLNLLNMPNVQLPNVGTLPILVNTVMLTGDLRGILWWAVMFAITTAIWYPFFKVYEKDVMKQEAEEAEKKAKEAAEEAAA
jgi:PTS system cellobiose-specific IIC component